MAWYKRSGRYYFVPDNAQRIDQENEATNIAEVEQELRQVGVNRNKTEQAQKEVNIAKAINTAKFSVFNESDQEADARVISNDEIDNETDQDLDQDATNDADIDQDIDQENDADQELED
jgi:hypothetical protein